MWLLTSEHSTDSQTRGKSFPLLLNKDIYEVGREKADILLSETSVSRRHAKLYPVSDCVKLEDEKSLFGTFLNNSKARIPKDEHTFLRDGDLISFGTLANAWRLSRVDISVITTKLDPRESLELKSHLRVLNGNFISSDWSNSVTHLVTSTNLAFTPKFLLALVNCVPVVTWTYFKEAITTLTESGCLPPVDKYTPSLTNFPIECDFRVNEERKNLFDGLVFIFLEERVLNVYQKLIKSAGGTATVWDKKKASIIRLASRVIVDSKKKAEQSELNDYLQTKGRRLIPDGEIGLAIAIVSTTKYCNAKYHPELGHILALETPCVQDCNSSDLILVEEIPETIVIDDDNVAEKSAMRPGMSEKEIVSHTEIPETVTGEQSCPPPVNASIQFPDDDEDDFNSRSQQILEIVDKYSSPALRKRKHSGEDSDVESQRTKKSSLTNEDSQRSNESQLSRFNSSQFIARPSQKRNLSQQVDTESMRAPIPPAVTNKPKRTLADLLAKDDDDSDEEELIFKKKSKVAPSKPVPPKGLKKTVPTLLPAAPSSGSSAGNSNTTDALDGPLREDVSRQAEDVDKKISLSQVTGWLSKKPTQADVSIKMESLNLDETHAWIGPLMNAIQVREIKVDLSNFSNNRTANSTISNASADSSIKKNFKTFKKQSFLKCGTDFSELTRTKSVLITEKL